jgi:hypothetical protein
MSIKFNLFGTLVFFVIKKSIKSEYKNQTYSFENKTSLINFDDMLFLHEKVSKNYRFNYINFLRKLPGFKKRYLIASQNKKLPGFNYTIF